MDSARFYAASSECEPFKSLSESSDIAPIYRVGKSGRRKQKRRFSRIQRQTHITFCVSECKYECVKQAAVSNGWKLVGGSIKDSINSQANIHWVDNASIADRLRELAPWQRINHFPGMCSIARKARMAQALDRMRRQFPLEYRFYPRTWVLPTELSIFRNEFDAQGRSSRTFIIKPDAGCQGKGIFLTQDYDERISGVENQVAQLYVRRPLLIEGFKFDLRVYVLVTSIRPLRVYVFRDGLARLCTNSYCKPVPANIGNRCMHLTNYAINRHNGNFVANEDAEHDDTGSKRSLRWLLEWIGKTYGESHMNRMWHRIGQCAVKTIVSILPVLHREYKATFGAAAYDMASTNISDNNSENEKIHGSCFGESVWGDGDVEYPPIEGSRCIEVLGFDFMIDEALKPWLIEVNHLPSFATDSPLDKNIKSRVVTSALSILQVKPTDRAYYDTNKRKDSQNRLYRKSDLSSNCSSKPESDSTKSKFGTNSTATRIQLVEIYEKYAPDKLDKIDMLLQKYYGREEKLLKMARKKYVLSTLLQKPSNEKEECDDTMTSRNFIDSVGLDRELCSSVQQDNLHADNIDIAAEDFSALSTIVLPNNCDGEELKFNETLMASSDHKCLDSALHFECEEQKQILPDISKEAGENEYFKENREKTAAKSPNVETGAKLLQESNSKIPLWAEITDPTILSWETNMLGGWDRFWPPLGPEVGLLGSSSTSTTRDEEGVEEDGAEDLSVPVPMNKRRHRTILEMMQFVFEDHNRQVQRLQAPLQQHRGVIDGGKRVSGGQDYVRNGPAMPSLPDMWRRSSGGGSISMGKPQPKLAPVSQPLSGLKQQERSKKLSSGYSVADNNDKELLRSLHPQRLSVASQRAQEWRRRLSEGRSKSLMSVPVKIHSFNVFGDEILL